MDTGLRDILFQIMRDSKLIPLHSTDRKTFFPEWIFQMSFHLKNASSGNKSLNLHPALFYVCQFYKHISYEALFLL